MSKKDRQITVNNISQLNLEIDYDKLADAIVKAQRKSEEQAKGGKYTKGVLTLPLSLFFRAISVIGWMIVLFSPYSLIQTFRKVSWDKVDTVFGNVFSIITVLAMMFSIALFSLILWKAAKEIEDEKDRYYLVALFSGIVSFIALIVAIIALYK